MSSKTLWENTYKVTHPWSALVAETVLVSNARLIPKHIVDIIGEYHLGCYSRENLILRELDIVPPRFIQVLGGVRRYLRWGFATEDRPSISSDRNERWEPDSSTGWESLVGFCVSYRTTQVSEHSIWIRVGTDYWDGTNQVKSGPPRWAIATDYDGFKSVLLTDTLIDQIAEILTGSDPHFSLDVRPPALMPPPTIADE